MPFVARLPGLLVVLACLFGPSLVFAQVQEKTKPPDESGISSATGDLPVSFDRIKRGLAARESPLAAASTTSIGTPTFRMTIVGHRFLMPDFKETLKPGWQPVAPGMLYHAEFLNMVTPGQARPYGAFVNGELLQVAFTSLVNHYTAVATKQAVKAVKRTLKTQKQRRIHEQVQEELAALERANTAAKKKEKDKPPDE